MRSPTRSIPHKPLIVGAVLCLACMVLFVGDLLWRRATAPVDSIPGPPAAMGPAVPEGARLTAHATEVEPGDGPPESKSATESECLSVLRELREIQGRLGHLIAVIEIRQAGGR